MYILKACPRCERGDLARESDEHGPRISCLQCSHTLSPEEESHVVRMANRPPRLGQ